jgi:hypothetical protein
VSNQDRFVVTRRIFKKRDSGFEKRENVENNRSWVIAIRAAAFENESSSEAQSTRAEAAARPAQATSKTTDASPSATRNRRPVKNNVNPSKTTNPKERYSAGVQRSLADPSTRTRGVVPSALQNTQKGRRER